MKEMNIKGLLPKLTTLLILLGGVLLIFTYSIGIHIYDKYDFLEGVYWAEATIESGGAPLSPNFYYQYTVPFGSNYLIAPFIMLLGPCLLANQLGMFVYYIIYLVLIFRLANQLFKDNYKYYFISISSLFIFTYVGDNMLHHILYYGIGFISLLGLITSFIDIYREKNIKVNLFLVFVFSLLSASNGIAAIGISSFPIFVAIVLLAYENKNALLNKDKKKYLSSLCTIAVSSLVGLVANFYVNNGMKIADDLNERLTLADCEQIAKNLTTEFIKDFLSLFITNDTRPRLTTFGGVSSLFSIFFCLIFVAASVISIKKIFKNTDCVTRFIYFSNIVTIIVCVFMHAISEASSERYLFNAFLSLSILIAIYLFEKKDFFENSFFRTVLLFVSLFLVLQLSANIITYDIKEEKNERDFTNIILENNLYYGFALPNDGYSLHIMSNGKINPAFMSISRVNPVYRVCTVYGSNFEENYLKPSNSDYFFVLASDEIYELLEKEEFINYKTDDIVIDYYHLFIYDVKYWDMFLDCFPPEQINK